MRNELFSINLYRKDFETCLIEKQSFEGVTASLRWQLHMVQPSVALRKALVTYEGSYGKLMFSRR